MKIIAIVPFTGSFELTVMAERCMASLLEHVDVLAMDNGAELGPTGIGIALGFTNRFRHIELGENIGFGKAVNRGIKIAMSEGATHVLVANSDLEFPQEGWFGELVAEVEGNYVLSPTTDITACPESRAAEAVDKSPVFSPQVSAFCWLVPLPVIKRIQARYGFELFDPHFFAYGEDDLTSAILRKQFGPKPFKVVRRSWVKHLKGKTAKEVGVRSGDPKNLKLLAERKRVLGVR